MKTNVREGQFEVIDSFIIRRRNEFYLIGQMKEGTVQEQWFVNVPLNRGLSLTLRISKIEEIEITSERETKNIHYLSLMATVKHSIYSLD